MSNPKDPPQSPIADAPTAARNGTLSDRVRSLRLKERTTPTAKRGSIIPWTLAAIFLIAAVLFAYRAYRTTPEQTSSPENEKLSQLLATAGSSGAAKDIASSGEVVLESKGYIIPLHQILVSPQVGGILVKVDPEFQEGAWFKKDQILAQIDDKEFRFDYEHAQAVLASAKERWNELENYRKDEVRQAQADVGEQESNLKQLKLELTRTEKLRATNSTAVRDYEQAQFSYDAMLRRVERLRLGAQLMERGPRDAKIAAAAADIKQAEADLGKARWRLDNCVIKAPIAGTILSKKAEEGTLVNPSAFSNGLASSLCEMADLSKIEVELSIMERDFAKVMVPRDGEYQLCTIRPEAFQRDERFLKVYPNGYEGYVSRVMPIADRAKEAMTVRVRVRVPESEAGLYLKPAMGVFVVLKNKTTKQVEKD